MNRDDLAKYQAEAFRQHRNIFIVGVAGIGKSSMGRLASEQVGVPYVDLERGYLVRLAQKANSGEAVPLNLLDRKFGRQRVHESLLKYSLSRANRINNHIISTSTRCLRFPQFWEMMQARGVTLHLHGMPYEVYERRCMRNLRLYDKKFKDDPRRIVHQAMLFRRPRKAYFTWDHARKTSFGLQANYSVRITGDLETDLHALCSKIRIIQGYLLAGGIPPIHDHEYGLGFRPEPLQCTPPSEILKQRIPEGLQVPEGYELPDLR